MLSDVRPEPNLYLRPIGRDRFQLVLPRADGTFPAGYIFSKDGYVARWPANPHSAYPTTIINTLKQGQLLRDAVIVFDDREVAL